MTHCIYCEHTKVYTLANGHKKCAKCKRKFSPKKVTCQGEIVRAFCEGRVAHATAKTFGIHYQSVHKKYMELRRAIAYKSQTDFEANLFRVKEYEEYIYMPRYKKAQMQALYEAFDILIFDYEGKIYTTMIRIETRYTSHNTELKELKKIFGSRKIAKLQSRENKIERFISFFEEYMNRFKGVGREQFFYYLKECEFCFNYAQDKRASLLEALLSMSATPRV